MSMAEAIILLFIGVVAAAVWFALRAARRENDRLNEGGFVGEADQATKGSGGGPKPVK